MGRDAMMQRLNEIVSMCEAIDDGPDDLDLTKHSSASAALEGMNRSLAAKLREAEEALRAAQDKLQASHKEAGRLREERDAAMQESQKMAAERARAPEGRLSEEQAAKAEAEARDLRKEVNAVGLCALHAMQGMLQCVGEQAGRIEAKCALIQQQPAETPTLLERISRCKRISREDLPSAAERGVRLRNQLSDLTVVMQNSLAPATTKFSRQGQEFNDAVERLKDDYTNIELELDGIYEDVRLAQSMPEEEDVVDEDYLKQKKNTTRRVMMSPEPPQIRMFEESEQALEERRKHWNNIEVEAKKLTGLEAAETPDEDSAPPGTPDGFGFVGHISQIPSHDGRTSGLSPMGSGSLAAPYGSPMSSLSDTDSPLPPPNFARAGSDDDALM